MRPKGAKQRGGRRTGPAGWRRAIAPAATAVLLLWAGAAGACDDFAEAPSSRWSIASGEDGPRLLTPCGDPFFSLGVNAIDGGASANEAVNPERAYRWQRFAGTRAEWAAGVRQRLLAWGFNTAGGWSVPPTEIGLPSTPELELGRIVQFVWTDPFDPALTAELRRKAAVVVAPYRGNPLRIGYFSDNEIGWWNGPLFVAFMTYPPENHTKQRLVALLREHYRENWHEFERDFVPAPGTASFDDLLASRAAPRLRPGGNGIEAVRAWTAIVAARYYSAMREALRAADPEALYLGDRLPIYYDPDAVRAMAPHVDAISVNYNVDTADGWIAPYFFDGLRDLSGGKPVLVTEWFYAAAENRSGNLNRTGPPREGAEARISNNRNRTGHLMTVATQQERARGAGRAAQLLAAAPERDRRPLVPIRRRADRRARRRRGLQFRSRRYRRPPLLQANSRLAGEQPAGALGHGPPDRPRTRRGSRPCPAAGLARADDADAGGLAEGGLAGADDRLPLRGAVRRCASGLERIRPVSRDDRDGLLRPRTARTTAQSFRVRRRSASRSGSRPAAGPRRIELRVVPHRTRPNRPTRNRN